MKKFSCLAVLIVFVLSSCSSFYQVQKRHYRHGFYVHHSNNNSKNVVRDSVSENELKKPGTKTAPSVPDVKSHPVFQKAVTVSERIIERVQPEIRKQVFPKINVHPNQVERTKKVSGGKDENDNSREVTESMTLGIIAFVFIVLGILIVEITPFGLVLILIGIFCAIFGLQIGRLALNYGNKKHHHSGDDKSEPSNGRKRAKRAYFLNLSAILFLTLYVLIRFGLAAAGSPFVVPILLCILLIILFILFRYGFFSDLKD